MSNITYLPGKEPDAREHRLIFKNIDRVGWDNSIDCYIKDGGYEQLKKAFTMEPQAITNEVKTAGLRGRGGAGFPTGVKWGFIPPNNTKPVYLICNCDESEPGTFKDRYIVHQDPHQLIEGMVISAFAVGANTAYIYIREEFPEASEILEKAIEDAREKNFLGDDILGSGFNLEIYLHRGAGAYICGEETGLIESLEGKRPYPRIKPPYFPAALGLYMSPTIVNNVESLCHVKHIIGMGGDEYAKLGTPRNTGTRILCVSGDVKKPGYYEVEVGKITMGELLNDVCGGPKTAEASKPSSRVVHQRRSCAVRRLTKSKTQTVHSESFPFTTSLWILIRLQRAVLWLDPVVSLSWMTHAKSPGCSTTSTTFTLTNLAGNAHHAEKVRCGCARSLTASSMVKLPLRTCKHSKMSPIKLMAAPYAPSVKQPRGQWKPSFQSSVTSLKLKPQRKTNTSLKKLSDNSRSLTSKLSYPRLTSTLLK